MIIYYYNILQCLQIQYYVLFEFYSSLSHGINVLNSRGNFLNIYWKISTCDAQPLSGHSVTSPRFPRMRFIRNPLFVCSGRLRYTRCQLDIFQNYFSSFPLLFCLQVFSGLKEMDYGNITVFYCGNAALGKILKRLCLKHKFGFKKENFQLCNMPCLGF